MTPQSLALIELVQGETSLGLAPWIGGSIAWFRWRGMDILRPATSEDLAKNDPLGVGNFPLLPFAGRIPGGRFRFDGREIGLPPNLPGESAAIHGQGWQMPWRTVGQTATSLSLRLDHPAGDWPWQYRADQILTLVDHSLIHRLSVTNEDTRPMPAGLGLHPYFPRDRQTYLSASVQGVFFGAADELSPLPPRWDWRADTLVEAPVDHQFGGWTSEATVRWPARKLAVELTCDPPTGYLVVYAPDGQDFFCVEPVGHRLDAINRSRGGAGHGMRVLAPGETAAMTVAFRPRAIVT